jgi:hypothetical protein
MSRKYRVSQRLRPQNKFFHSVIAGCGFAVIIIGLIAFTNFAASRMERVSAARSDTQSTAIAGASPETTPETTLAPKSKLDAVQIDNNGQNSAVSTSSGTSSSTKSVCNSTARRQVVTAFTGLLSAENTEHKHNLSSIIASIEKTSLFTQILNPGMMSSKISSENQRHQQAIKSLTSKEVHELTAIHCKL